MLFSNMGEKENLDKKTVTKVEEPKNNPKKKRIGTLLVVVFAVTLFLVLNFNLFVAGTVNGFPISRIAVIRELEKQGGSQILDNLVIEMLIIQEGGKNGIVITDQMIQEEIKIIEEQLVSQGIDLEQALSLQGQTISDLEKSIKTRLTVEKLLGDEVGVSEEEINTYYEENSEFYPEGTTLENIKDDIEDQLKQQKIAGQYEKLISDLKENSSIKLFVFK